MQQKLNLSRAAYFYKHIRNIIIQNAHFESHIV